MDWSAVRAFYIRTRSIKAAAEKHGLPLNTVKTRARREAWAKLEGSSGELAEPSEGSTEVHFEPSQDSSTDRQRSSRVHLEPSEGTRRVQAEPSESIPGFKIEPPLNPEAARAVAAGEPSEFHIPAEINGWDRLTAAKFYLQQLHWAVHHLFPPDKGEEKERGKRPWSKGWREHQSAHVTVEGLEEVFRPRLNNNLGVIMRPPFVAVDLDSKPDKGASVLAWLSLHPQLAHVPRERTAGGVHLHFICRNLPSPILKARKPPTVNLGPLVTAELYSNGFNLVVAPSIHKSGHRYTWEVTGSIPEVSWEQLCDWFGFGFGKTQEKRGPGRPPKNNPWWSAFKGDIDSLDILALFRSADLLGECIDPDVGKWAVRCPWAHEHSGDTKGQAGSDTVVFTGKKPAFKCLHAHCHERKVEHVCEWFENREPGIVDKFCRALRVFEEGAKTPDGRPRIQLPCGDREDSDFARDVADVLGPKRIWFLKGKRVVCVDTVRFSEKVSGLGLVPLEPIEARTAVEDHLQTGSIETDRETGDRVFIARTMTRECAAGMLGAPQFKRRLPWIMRILDLPLPIRLPGGDIVLPKPGYDPRFKIYTDPDSPPVRPMSIDEARHWMAEAHDGFCWLDAQSLTHQIARVITPFCRGLMGWDSRFPLWHYNANRPRAGKDYLAGVAHMIYEGHSCEDSALERDSEENRKRITAALMAGRRMFHFANCQGHISDACFIGAITSKAFGARNIGSTDSKADLKLPNEIEFSISANIGLTYRPDVEPRTRRISLTFSEENANARTFPKPDLWGWLLDHRSQMLSAVSALVNGWMEAGCPKGSTPFSSFPEWSAVVGGIMQVNGLGDPCRSHDDDGGLPADKQTDAMRSLFAACHARHGDAWITKGEIYDVIVASDDNEAFGWFGDLEEKGVKVKVGLQLRQFRGREFGGVILQMDDSTAKSQQHRYRFVTETGTRVNFVRELFGASAVPSSPPHSHSDGHLGQVGHLPTSPSVQEKNNSFHNQKPEIIKLSDGVEGLLKVPNLPKVPKPRPLVGSREQLPEIAALIRQSGSVALDLETYGSGKGDGLDPWKGDIRLLSLCVPGGDAWLLDLRTIGYNLGELKDALEISEITAHNAKFDLLWLRVKCGLQATKVFCTLTTARLLTAGTRPGNNLDQCLERYCGIKPAADHSTSNWGGMMLTDAQLAYAARDVDHLHQLAVAQRELIAEARLDDVWQLEMRLLPAVVEIEASGIAVDRDRLKSLQHKHHAHALELAAQLRELLKQPGLNPSSPAQLTKALQACGINIDSTNEDTLKAANDGTIVPALLDFRAADKLAQQADTLLSHVRFDGRIHGRFDPTGTATGRFSSKEPNMQNIGRGELRSCFIPVAGHKLIVADYSQIELRAAAAIAGETKMIEAYQRREDLHRKTAAAVLGKPPEEVTGADRQTGKAVSFGLIFGQSPPGLVRYAASSYGVKLELEQAQEIRQAFFRLYGALRQWHGESHFKAKQGIREVRTVSGRRRIIPSEASEWERFTALVNTPVQGSCADGMKRAIVRLHHELPIEARIVSTVHDELLVEAPEKIAAMVCDQVNQVMCEAMSDLFPTVPIEVEAHVCDNWGEK